MFQHQITIRFKECDPLGHVNNVNYFAYFEEARNDIFRIFNPDLNIHDWNLIVASTQCDYIRELTYPQKVTVLTWIGHVGNSSFIVEQAIQNEDGHLAARGKAVLVHFDFKERKSIPLTTDIKEALLIHTESPL